MFRRRRTSLALGLSLMLSWACSVNPATGKRERNIYSTDDEIALGERLSSDLVDSVGLYADPQLSAYVTRIGLELAAQSERPDLPWNFGILDTPIPNAVAVPGGHVYVTRGLLALLNSEAQLAAVMAHEVGHVSARHSTRELSREALGSALDVQGVFGGVGALSRRVRVRRHFAHSREHEFEADKLGIRYLEKSGYQTTALAESISALTQYAETRAEIAKAKEKVADKDAREKKEDEIPAWRRSHPASADRVLRLAGITKDEGGQVLRRDYLTRIDGLVFGRDAREGFFSGDLFIHPKKGYSVTLPPGWEAMANGDSIMAVPNAKSDKAFMIWFTSDHSSVQLAKEDFFKDSGLPEGELWTRDLGDSESIAVGIGGHTSSSTLHGMLGFTKINGMVMVVLAIAPASQWSTMGPLAFESFSSLRVERDPARLGLQPVRLGIRTMPPQGLDGVASAPLERGELEAINQGKTGLGEDGTLVKIAVGAWPDG